MMNIIWTREAALDLKLIYSFYQPLNPVAAKTIYNAIRTVTKYLKTFPKLGKIEPLLADKPYAARSLVVCKIFKVVYYIDENNIYITNIWDCRQNPQTLIQKIR